MTPHPAKFSKPIIPHLREIVLAEAERLGCCALVLDPFAGVGGVHVLTEPTKVATFGAELEPEWADQHPRTFVGDATALDWKDSCFHAIVTSPCYGNRMADSFQATDESKRHTYHHYLGRRPTDGSAAVMVWGRKYREFHELAWAEALRVLRPGGLMVVNISNHIRDDEEQPVVEWHAQTLMAMGCLLVEARRVSTHRNTHGANRRRVDGEMILVFRSQS